jgi:uncharacterized protein (DUF885 family)
MTKNTIAGNISLKSGDARLFRKAVMDSRKGEEQGVQHAKNIIENSVGVMDDFQKATTSHNKGFVMTRKLARTLAEKKAKNEIQNSTE